MAAMPGRSGHIAQHFTSAPPNLVSVRRQVSVSVADRRAIDRLLDRFVPDAVGRRDPGAAYALATPALRAGSTAADWRRGQLPVQPLPVRDTTFGGWVPSYSFADEVNFDLLVHARRGGAVGAISYTVDVKRVHGHWLVDSFVPAALFAPEGAVRRIISHVDYGPGATAK